ncbi:phage portal protein [Kaistia sp. 32K]|uniref:phage portal protein n=1 Tax=Kaistia sp. 32K TaxID=2795690 RepID=UPI001915E9BB|nr:phage portal protein [Kaistia sp. 32K]BCP53791.1 phage portal protein [Kaistia sp. 32K]
MNWLDSAIGLFAPRTALDRARARATLEGFQKRAYEGAALGRHTDGWHTASTSADSEIMAAGPRLRDRVRDLVRNNPHAAKAVSVWVANLIGEGIVPRANTGDDKKNARVMDAYKEWARNCDPEGLQDFYGLQTLAAREMVEGGEVLGRRRIRRSSDGLRVPLQLQLLESDFIDSSRVGGLPDGGSIINGIEFNPIGGRRAYWLWSTHPGNSFLSVGSPLQSSAVPASEVLHLFDRQRTQTRGVPWGAPSIRDHRDLADYTFAEGIRKKIEASMVGVVIGDDENDIGINPVDANGKPPTPGVVGPGGSLLEKFAPGMFAYLRGGKDIKFNQPAVVAGFRDNKVSALQDIAAGWRVPYALMTGDLSEVNFSSARVEILEFRRLVRQIQWQIIIPMFLQPVWEWFCEAAWLAGEIPDRLVPVEWNPPKFEWVDPLKDATAELLAIRAGTRSPQDVISDRGRNPDDVLADFVAWNKKLDALGIILDSDPRKTAKTGVLQSALDAAALVDDASTKG